MSEKNKIKYGINLIRPFLEFNKKELSYIAKKYLEKHLKIHLIQIKKFLRTNIRNLKKNS